MRKKMIRDAHTYTHARTHSDEEETSQHKMKSERKKSSGNKVTHTLHSFCIVNFQCGERLDAYRAVLSVPPPSLTATMVV